MVSEIDYAVLSAAAYQDARGEPNVTPLPTGWSVIDTFSNATGGVGGFLSTGLSATAYRNGENLVIAFKGTDFLVGSNNYQTANDLLADVALGGGINDQRGQHRNVFKYKSCHVAHALN